MKKSACLLLALLLALTLCACGGGGKGFAIEGKWKNTGEYTFGQVQSGAIVAFDGKNCNFFSPQDTYAFYQDGDDYKLECTSLLFAQTLSFKVRVINNDSIEIVNGSYGTLELSRVS